MNAEEKEEAHRPRPLSAGIWTLFSWLRRTERSSSSESVSSVGSARTAVSFDFLAPGNYNFTNKPIVLTTALNPPTETYKKRLQERNLRRQCDRDVTLHRKYGLFREHGNGYDGYTLPSTRRTLGNTVDRPNRERRATSEFLQRRAAYVPGKRRAPLPPAIATTASFPRTYKRKRPAPKPPVKNTLKENNIVHQINDPIRMTSNSEPDAKLFPDNQLFNNSKIQKCDKKITSKDTKSRTDKNFLKHIFENRKRSSVIETTSVRLLPSISELDKQATEIIENNRLRQKVNNVNRDVITDGQTTSALYEGNSWFCISCLRKYNSSVDSCNHCLSDNRHPVKKDGLKYLSPRSSIYTQTNVETTSYNRSSMDERKLLKDILKEMKDSLPKKNKDNKVNVSNEFPTLRIGSTVEETDLTPQPSSSNRIHHNKERIFSISPLLSETRKNYDQKNIIGQPVICDIKSEIQDEKNIQSSSAGSPVTSQEHISPEKEETREKNILSNQSPTPMWHENVKRNTQEKNITIIPENKDLEKRDNIVFDNIKTESPSQSRLVRVSIETNDHKETNTSNLQVSQKTSSNMLHRAYLRKDEIQLDSLNKAPNTVSSTSAVNNVSMESDKVRPNSSELQFLSFPNTRSVVVNNVTVVTAHSNNKSSEKLKKVSVKKIENDSIQSSSSKIANDTKTTDTQVESPIKRNNCPSKNVEPTNNPTCFEIKANLIKPMEISIDKVKPEYNLYKPLNITSLLNPLYSPKNTTAKENINIKINTSQIHQKELSSNIDALKAFDIDNVQPKVNKKLLEKSTPHLIDTISSDLSTENSGTELAKPEIKEPLKKDPLGNDVKIKDVLYVQKDLPSTSGCVINSHNNVNNLDHHDQRRHLINQLEQSIAKGDEVAAADAAVKLAKLRLSCSVLSFSSQIVREATSANENERYHPNIRDTNISLLGTEDVKKSKPIKKTLDTHEASKKDKTGVGSELKPKSQIYISEPSTSTNIKSEEMVLINVWIEDKQAARGPIKFKISKRATVADLRRQAEHSLGLAPQLQRWIVGRTLCSDDTSPIAALAGPHLRAPFYLCIVQPDQNDKPETDESITDGKDDNATDQNGEFYTELMELEKQSLVPNIEPFECGVCMEECAAGAGVVLRECIHTFCRECLSDVVQHSQEPAVACPATGCSGFLQEREIRTIVTPEEYERWLARGLATAECGTRNAFHCRTRDCTGWAFCDPGVRRFPCPVCKNTNCVQCQAIHEGETCDQYQTKLRQAVAAAETNKDDEGTQALLNSLMSRGEALECPECKAIITKKWGCDWVKCSACKTEICWVTKGRRWGPGGRGDTSGGCRCGVNGQRCHPSCGYCH